MNKTLLHLYHVRSAISSSSGTVCSGCSPCSLLQTAGLCQEQQQSSSSPWPSPGVTQRGQSHSPLCIPWHSSPGQVWNCSSKYTAQQGSASPDAPGLNAWSAFHPELSGLEGFGLEGCWFPLQFTLCFPSLPIFTDSTPRPALLTLLCTSVLFVPPMFKAAAVLEEMLTNH